MCKFLWCFEFKQTFIRDFSLLRTKATFRFLIENRWDDVFPPIKLILKSFSKPQNSVSFHQRLRPESILFGVWDFFPVLLGTYYLIWRTKRFQLLIKAIILKKKRCSLIRELSEAWRERNQAKFSNLLLWFSSPARGLFLVWRKCTSAS